MALTHTGWSQIEVAGHPCDVFEPVQPIEPRQVVCYLHGVHQGRLIENVAYTRLFDEHGLTVIAPHTGRSWWCDRICAEFDTNITAERYLLDSIVPYIAERWQAAPPGIALFGTSMGGQGALRLAFKYPNRFPIACALAPAIDHQICYEDYDDDFDSLRQMYPDAESVRQDTATLHVHPLNWPRNIFFACDPNDWPWIDSAQKLQMKLSALGIPHEVDFSATGGGHGFDYYNQMAERAVQFMSSRLKQERLRVV